MVRTESYCDGFVLHIELNRPKANILDEAMIRSIDGALDAEVTQQTRLIVFEGAGNHFCFGASVEEHRAEKAQDMLTAFHGLFRKLAKLAIPTCAVVRGQCLGGGMELACWCSWIVATPDAQFGQPEIKLAVFPPMASILLPWRCGGQLALDLCLTGRSLNAEQALQLGVISAVAENPKQWWQSLVQDHLSKTSATSLRFVERAVRLKLQEQMDCDLPKLERLYVDELMKTHDANEGINSFLERRSPNYISN